MGVGVMKKRNLENEVLVERKGELKRRRQDWSMLDPCVRACAARGYHDG